MADPISIALPFGKVSALVGGAGETLVLLPHEFGQLGWGRFPAALALRHRVVALSPPGFDGSDRPAWLRNVPDLAALVGQALDRLEWGPVTLLGLGFGGWVAAELAVRSPARVGRLWLQAPMGVKPPEGEIIDQFLVSAATYVEMGFSSAEAFAAAVPEGVEPHLERWEDNREMTTRIAWKPYMVDPALPHLLAGLRVPATITWCAGDRIVPRSAALAYAAAIPGARLETLDTGGHAADLEIPDRLAATFLDQRAA